jgi:hypothetical protein
VADYYVRKTGSDSNGGTSPADAWLTVTKALTTISGGGHNVYVGAGTYRETVTPNFTATSNINIIGDVTGQYTGDSGRVIITGFTTDDKTAPSATATLTLTSRRYLTWKNFLIVGSQTAALLATIRDCTFQDCCFLPGNHVNNVAIVNLTGTVDVDAAVLFERCVFFNPVASTVVNTLPTSTTADYNAGISYKNCLFLGAQLNVGGSGANSFKGGGVAAWNCTFFGALPVSVPGSTISTSIPCTIYNSVVLASSTALSAGTSGQLIEDYNVLHAPTARTNVTAGSNSISSRNYALMFSLCDWLWKMQPRPFLMPMDGSPFLAFGAQASGPTEDILGASRPSGGASTSYAVGAFERGKIATRETSTVYTGGGSAYKLTGPGYHDFTLGVDAASTTVSVRARYDTNHGTTNKPQIAVLNGGGCGVSDATATMTDAADTWEELQLNFTPTSKGVVTIRLISRSAAGDGIALFDA